MISFSKTMNSFEHFYVIIDQALLMHCLPSQPTFFFCISGLPLYRIPCSSPGVPRGLLCLCTDRRFPFCLRHSSFLQSLGLLSAITSPHPSGWVNWAFGGFPLFMVWAVLWYLEMFSCLCWQLAPREQVVMDLSISCALLCLAPRIFNLGDWKKEKKWQSRETFLIYLWSFFASTDLYFHYKTICLRELEQSKIVGPTHTNLFYSI